MLHDVNDLFYIHDRKFEYFMSFHNEQCMKNSINFLRSECIRGYYDKGYEP